MGLLLDYGYFSLKITSATCKMNQDKEFMNDKGIVWKDWQWASDDLRTSSCKLPESVFIKYIFKHMYKVQFLEY